MSVLRVEGLRVAVDGHEILRGVDLEIASGEVHALMGPNGSGKSTLAHALMGRSDYQVVAGSITIDGEQLVGLPPWQRAARGLFLALQYPTELPGVRIGELLGAALEARGEPEPPDALASKVAAEAARLDVDPALLRRGLNVEFSGGEAKRAETLQLALLAPRFAVLDEIDSGLDVDALGDVARRIEAMTEDSGLGVLAITHYARVLSELRADRVHVLMAGRVVARGGPELADRLERLGYEGLAAELGVEELAVTAPAEAARPFSDPTVESNPFADPLA